jgi:hypothetical protein
MIESRGDGRLHGRSARGMRRWSAHVGFSRLGPAGSRRLEKSMWAATSGRGRPTTDTRVGVRSVPLLGWLAGLGDGPMDPSHRVMNIYIYIMHITTMVVKLCSVKK